MAKTSASDLIAVPKAGGALKGLGETFSPDLHTGTGNFTVPITVPAGRNGLQPELKLSYSTGNGNGPFGLGWTLSVAGVARSTKKIPRYQESDIFVLSGAEDLVLVEHGNGFIRYRPRTEGLFARIRHYVDATGDYWQVKTRDGLSSLYGTPRPTNAPLDWIDPAVVRDPDPEKPHHVFGWKLTRTLDPFGNRIEYAYERDATAVDGPHRWDQVYLSEIRYVDYGDDPEQPKFLVSIRFVYEVRPDPFSDYRAGFEIRTIRRCARIEVYTQAADPILTRTYRLTYLDQIPDARLAANGVSLLARVQVIGQDGLKTEALPPLDFGYSEFQPNRRNLIQVAGEAFPPASLAHRDFELVDVTGNGLPDLVEVGDGARFWPNAGAGSFDLPREMALAPAGFRLSDPGVQMLDADGDGRPDLMVTNGTIAGYFPLRFGGEWDASAFRPYSSTPSFNLEDPEVRLIDLDGDGVIDAMRPGDRLECFFNDPEHGWQDALRLDPPPDPEFPRSFAAPRVKFVDMTGDGLQDVVLVFDRNIQYWPNLGYGRWADRVDMRNAPALPDGYDPRRLLVGDVDGDGVADLVYVGDTEVTVWINRSGNEWAEPVTIAGTPPINDFDAIRLADLLGSGVSGILWSSDAGALPRASMFFLDLTGGTKPYLLREMTNNMGATTRVGYASSTRFYLQDQKRFSTRWKTPLPFPVQVVARVEVIDEVSRGKLTTDYIYHHGYWDGAEREFRGFGRVDQRDTEVFENYHDTDLHPDRTFAAIDIRIFSPPTETRTWFHQGPVGDEFGEWEEVDFGSEFWRDDAQVLSRPRAMREFLASLPRQVKRDALRALRGRILRTEAYALDGTEREDRPWTVTEHLYGLREEESPDGNDELDRKHIFFPHPLGERITQWERGSDPMTRLSFSGDYTAYGLARSQISIAVPRQRDYLGPIAATARAPEKYLATHGITDYAERDDGQAYIVDRVARTTTFEVDNHGRDDVFTLKRDIEKGKYDTNNKLIAQSRNYYDGPAFEGLPLGQLGAYGALTRTETLILTESILRDAYRSGTALINAPEGPPYLNPVGPPEWTTEYPEEFRTLLPTLAGYLFHPRGPAPEDVGGYFSQSVRRGYDFHGSINGRGRGLILRTRDPLGRETSITYDSFDLLAVSVTNPARLVTLATYDYRIFQPRSVLDANRNQCVFSFTPLGLLKETFVRGKAGEGDRFEPSTRMTYNFLAFIESKRLDPNNPQPIYVHSSRRVHHDSETDVLPAERNDTIEGRQFSDGFGRLLQTRAQTEDVLFGDSVFGDTVLPAYQDDELGTRAIVTGRQRMPGDPPHVIVSGWSRYDNKQRVVQKYEPFYSEGFEYAAPSDAQLGEKVEMYYDPLGRVIRSVNPDGSEQRVIFGVPGTIFAPDFGSRDVFEPTPWEAYTYDPNDNAGRTHPATSGAFRHHWDTPNSILVDGLGRTVQAVARNRQPPPSFDGPLPPIEEIVTRSTYDIRGNLLILTDALQRPAFIHTYDLANRPLRIESIDAGVRRTVLDAAGKTIEHRTDKGSIVLNIYGTLNRLTHLWARDAAGEPVSLRERLLYGDDPALGLTAAQVVDRNLLGKLYLHYDEAGRLALKQYDFRGNLIEKERQVISTSQILSVFAEPAVGWSVRAYRVDWAPNSDSSAAALEARASVLLDPTIYKTSSAVDALNRIKSMRYPQDVERGRKELRPTYNRAGDVEQVSLGGETYVARIAYNAKGQRVFVAYGNGVMTRYAYDAKTFRLTRLRTEGFNQPTNITYRPSGTVLQDFGYHFDLAGNIRAVTDRTPESGIPNTLLGRDALDRGFEYDAIYRLLSATGRECALPPDMPWGQSPRCTDVTRARAYTEQYQYDPVGNILQLKHLANGAGFTRNFTLISGNGGAANNRLVRMAIGEINYDYVYDDNGSMTDETTSRHFEWDYSDRLRVFRTQTTNSEPTVHAHYLYDSGGRRIMKVVRQMGGSVELTVYIDGIFEHHRQLGGSIRENNALHVMDDRGRVALLRVGPDFFSDATPPIKYHLNDHLGSSNVIIGGADSTAAELVNREEYTPYGETSFGSFARKRYRFSGKELDEESGLYYFGARYLACRLGRWANCDPLGIEAGINLYSFVKGKPLVKRDTTGLQDDDASTNVKTEITGDAGASPPLDFPQPKDAGAGPTDVSGAASSPESPNSNTTTGRASDKTITVSEVTIVGNRPIPGKSAPAPIAKADAAAAAMAPVDAPPATVGPLDVAPAAAEPKGKPMSAPDLTCRTIPDVEAGMCHSDPQPVWICREAAQLGVTAIDMTSNTLNYLGDLGNHHWWVATKRRAAGMAPSATGTELQDHSGRVFKDCRPIPGVDPACVDARLSRLGQPTGTWSVDLRALSPDVRSSNTCQSLSLEIVESCGGPSFDEKGHYDPWSNYPDNYLYQNQTRNGLLDIRQWIPFWYLH
jgi:RHS repeat-associated protein